MLEKEPTSIFVTVEETIKCPANASEALYVAIKLAGAKIQKIQRY